MSEFHGLFVESGNAIRLKTAGKYCDRDIVVSGVGNDGEGVTATPDEVLAGEKFIDANGSLVEGTMPKVQDGMVVLNTKKTTHNIPKGYHSGNGTVTVGFDRIMATPTKELQVLNAGDDFISEVHVQPIPDQYVVPSGSLEIKENGTFDVAGKASANVNVPIPSGYIKPSGTKEIVSNGTHDVTEYASVNVNVPSSGGNSGVNIDIYDPVKHPIEQGNIQSASAADFASTTRLRVKGYVEVKPNTAYRISTNLYKMFLIQCYADKTPISNTGWQASPYLINTNPSCAYIRLTFQNSSGSTITVDEFEWLKIEQLEGGGGSEDLDEVLAEQEQLIDELKSVLANKAAGGGEAEPIPTQEKTIDIVENGTVVVSADEGYSLSKVTANVNVPIPDGYVQYEDVANEFILRTLSGECSNDQVTKIPIGGFAEFKNLTKVSFPNVTEIKNYCFQNCTALKEVDMPNITAIGSYAFDHCTSLETFNFPLAKSAGTYAFQYAKLPANVYLPAMTSIGTYTFGYITTSHTLHLPSLATFAGSAARDNKGLTKVELDVASKIDNLAFYYCSGLATLILRKSDAICTLSNTNAFTGTPIVKGTGYIYVPAALIDTYKSATNWSTFSAQFKTIEGSEYE